MPDSLKEQMKQDLSCSHVLDCLYDLREIDKRCYEYLNGVEGTTDVKQLSEKFDRDQSTIHRSLERLMNCNMVEREKQTYDEGGYQFVYVARDPEEISKEMEELLADWNNTISNLIEEFNREYQ